MKTKKKIELPLLEPIYSTYHNQGPGTAILFENPSIRNWYLNQVMILTCKRKFLSGFTSPEIHIAESTWNANPYIERTYFNMQFLKGQTHYVIRNLLNEGYYVCFSGIDDYYVEGKTWYQEKHFSHDGCICGYDQEKKTYSVYSYDQNWIYQRFQTTQMSFDQGRKAMFKKGEHGNVCGIKPKKDQISFSSEIALQKIAEYLDSNMEKYPEDGIRKIFGIVVHDYIAKYVRMLHEDSIPYEKMDRRVFRLIWEHKKVMHQRIKLIESELFLDNTISNAYQKVVHEADNCRMLYASHHMKRRDSVLPIIQKKLIYMKELEEKLLKELLQHQKGTQLK